MAFGLEHLKALKSALNAMGTVSTYHGMGQKLHQAGSMFAKAAVAGGAGVALAALGTRAYLRRREFKPVAQFANKLGINNAQRQGLRKSYFAAPKGGTYAVARNRATGTGFALRRGDATAMGTAQQVDQYGGRKL